MATSQEIQCTNITIEAMNMVSFVMNDVPKIMTNLDVFRMNYFIGGSMLHGINLSRTPHNIDIIVRVEDFDRIKKTLEDSCFYKVLPIDSYDKGNILHVAFEVAEGPKLDILCNKPLEVGTMRDRSIKLSTETLPRIASLQELIKAKEWFNSENATLKELALQAFSELTTFDFTKIKTFEDALTALEYKESTKVYIRNTINDISMYSRASAAMSKLNIIRKALNLGQDLHLTKDPKNSHIYYPYNPFVTKSSTYYKNELNSGKMEVIGKIKSEGKEYNVLNGIANSWGHAGLGGFFSDGGVGYASDAFGFLGCVTKEIAEHFGKYFGMLITEAKYGDMVDFEIIEEKYKI